MSARDGTRTAPHAALEVRSLTVVAPTPEGPREVVRDLDLLVPDGGALGIVGESGSGKSLTLRAVLGLLPAGVRVTSGTVVLRGEGTTLEHDLTRGPLHRLVRRRGGPSLGLVFQDPATALDPLTRVGALLREACRYGGGSRLTRAGAAARTRELLLQVGLDGLAGIEHRYPHELSGGQRQRVVIALALARRPRVLLCDEPTTALDVTVQARILALLQSLRRDTGTALVLVSHDLAVVASVCPDLVVMHTGETVERGPTRRLLTHPAHPYTRSLVTAARALEEAVG